MNAMTNRMIAVYHENLGTVGAGTACCDTFADAEIDILASMDDAEAMTLATVLDGLVDQISRGYDNMRRAAALI